MPPLGLITLEIEGIRPPELERLRGLIHRMIIQGVLSVRPGSVTINFDAKGEISSIETKRLWRPLDKSTPERIDARAPSDTIRAS